ncbi:DUF5131 family protein [candidate division KSB1 bacterium]
MSLNSPIEWTESTWNPVTGCTKVSAGCKHCYAERFAKRLKAMGQKNYRNGFEVTLHEHVLNHPLKWKKPHTVFVNSMSDLFHEDIPVDYILKVFRTMNEVYWHRFQVLTKRSERLQELNSRLPWKPNIWMGVTVENSDNLHRIDHLRSTDAHIKFLSLEPLLGPINSLDLSGIDWVIAGGESGPGSRHMKKEWIMDIRNQCIDAGVSFFFKQWGGVNKKKAGRMLDGRLWSDMPEDKLEIREYGQKCLV